MIGYFGEPERDIRDVLIAELFKQRDELLAAAKLVLGNASLDEGFTALTEAVRKCEGEAK